MVSDQLEGNKSALFSLEIDLQARHLYSEMAKWTMGIAILGFIGMGSGLITLIVHAIIKTGFIPKEQRFITSTFEYTFDMILGYVVICSVFVYPCIALLRFSISIKKALQTNNKWLFNSSIAYLRGLFRYIGISFILFLAVMILALLITLFFEFVPIGKV